MPLQETGGQRAWLAEAFQARRRTARRRVEPSPGWGSRRSEAPPPAPATAGFRLILAESRGPGAISGRSSGCHLDDAALQSCTALSSSS